MLNQELILKRLSLIKYLYRIGVQQSEQHEPVCSFSILSFHDSIEMFVKLLAEKMNIKSKDFNFMEYWSKIQTLTLNESMRTLNDRRVNIKHKGLLPSKSDIEISRVNTLDFFIQNTFKHFNVEFNDISLFNLIKYETVRLELEEAQKSLENNQPETSIEKVAISFYELLKVFEKSKSKYSSSPFDFGKKISNINNYEFSSSGVKDEIFGKKVFDFAKEVSNTLGDIQSAIKIISFGLDYKKYIKFKILTPTIIGTMGGKHHSHNKPNKKLTKENCQFCINFVLESALNMQEYDYDISELLNLESRHDLPTLKF